MKYQRETVEVCAGMHVCIHGLDCREGGGQYVDSAVRQPASQGKQKPIYTHTHTHLAISVPSYTAKNHCSLFPMFDLCAAL